MKYFLLHFIFLIFVSVNSYAQTNNNDTIIVQAIVYQGDTISYKELEFVYIGKKLSDEEYKKFLEWTRLRNAVYVTYPYAMRAGALINEINSVTANMSDADKKKYIHTREKDLRREFTKPLSNLSVYQGKVLMKLINRETGNSCYAIVKEYKGGFTAGVYNTVLYFFNTSLKQKYDPTGEDLVMERIVLDVRRMYGYN